MNIFCQNLQNIPKYAKWVKYENISSNMQKKTFFFELRIEQIVHIFYSRKTA